MRTGNRDIFSVVRFAIESDKNLLCLSLWHLFCLSFGHNSIIPSNLKLNYVLLHESKWQWKMFIDFVMSLAEFDLSDAQSEHVSIIEQLVPSMADLRSRLISDITEKQFWLIYFILLLPRLNEDDLELLSTPEARLSFYSSLLQIKPLQMLLISFFLFKFIIISLLLLLVSFYI